MPLFRGLGEHDWGKAQHRWRRQRNMKHRSSWREDEDGSVTSLTRMCLLSLADNMKEVWVKDYADNYLDQYSFRYIMGPFNVLPGELVEELTCLLCTRKELSRAALHLLLVPQLRNLSLETCPGLVTSALCAHIAARCQGLCSLDLSGAQHLPSRVLCETLHSLPVLRSLSLAGLPCDRSVILTVACCCRSLRHLDVSRCHLLSPTALLPLGGGPFCASSASPTSSSSFSTSVSQPLVSCSVVSSSFPATLSPLPLSSLLALDIGFGEQEGDPVLAAAYLLLSLPHLERVAMEELGLACRLIERQEFDQADEFADREGVPRLEEVWRERMRGQGRDNCRKKRKWAPSDEVDESEEEERIFWEGEGCEIEKDAVSNEGPSCSHNQMEEEHQVSSQSDQILHLRNVKGVTCDCLDSLFGLCPGIVSMSVNMDTCEDTSVRSQGSLLAAGIQRWSGQLQSLSLLFPGPLVDLLLALQVTGSSLISLTLEGVKTSPRTPLMEVLRACPRLKELHISAEPPSTQEVDVDDLQDDRDPPQLSNLRSLALSFSYEHNQMMPVMSWKSLRKVLSCLLNGSPLLEKLSLVSLPCSLNLVLQSALRTGDLMHHFDAKFTESSPMPLEQVQYIELMRTDVWMTTVRRIMQRSKRLKYVDVSYCWQIKKCEWLDCKRFSTVQVVWV